ncbi:MAG: glutathione S-transferase family protein [Arenibacterium sp.]
MIDYFAWGTPNNHRVSIMLEELELDYTVHPRNIRQRENFSPEILAINPMGKLPVLIDRDPSLAEPVALFESGAILFYFAEKTGRFLPSGLRERAECMTWFMFVLTQVGQRLNASHHYRALAPERLPQAIAHHDADSRRVFAALDSHLAERTYLAGDYSIADIACFPWIGRHYWAEIELTEYPALNRWFQRIAERPAVQRGLAVPGEGVVW